MATKTWNIDTSHSEVTFTIRHMVVAKVRGQFNKWSGSATLDSDNFAASTARVELETASIDTREEKRDGHLRSADFFDADKFPKITFTSTRIEGSGKEFKLHGELDMHGIKKPVTLKVEDLGKAKDPWGNDRLLFHAETSFNRKDWGLNWNQALEMGGVLVGEDVKVDMELQFVAAA